MGIIDIDKSIVPYSFEVELEGDIFQFTVKYNESFDFFTLDLYKNNEILVYGEKIVFRNVLFEQYKYLGIPKPLLFVSTQTFEESRVTFENMNEDMFIFVISESDLNVD